MTEKDILEDKIERYIKAYFPPHAPSYAYRVYAFLRQNDSHVIVAGGMQHLVLGLDKSKLAPIAQAYGLDFGAIIPFVQLYEQAMLKKQQRVADQSNN